jgi:excisionase family DNA binding protein
MAVSLHKAAELSKLSRGILRQAIKANDLPATRVGAGSWLIDRRSLNQFAEQYRATPSTPPNAIRGGSQFLRQAQEWAHRH